MKIKADRAPSFRPITLTIVIETNREYEMLKGMAALDHTLPTAIAEDMKVEAAYDEAQTFLGALAVALHD